MAGLSPAMAEGAEVPEPGRVASAKGVQRGDPEGVVHKKVWGFGGLSLVFP
jgi:hypothetical protein